MQLPQAVWIALQARAVAIELTNEVLKLREAVAKTGVQRRHAAIELLHLGQLRLAGGQVIQHRWGFLRAIHQPSHQGHHPFLETHPMGKPVLFVLQTTALRWVLQLGRLQVIQQLLLPLQVGLQREPIGLGLLQSRGRLPPRAITLLNGGKVLLQVSGAKAIQPAALLTRPGQLLGLPLNREIQQQGPERLDLLTVDRNAIESMAARESIVLLAPFAAQQHLLLIALQLLLTQPLLQRRTEGKTGFNHPLMAALAQQPRPLPPQEGVEGIQKNGLTGSGLTGKHREALTKLQLQLFDQSNVLETQTGKHKQPGVGPDRSGCLFRLEGGHVRHRPHPCRSSGGCHATQRVR